MALAAAVEPSNVAVIPGDVATALLRIWNRGDVVDRVTLEVLGPAAGWVAVEPAEVSIMPGDESSATLLVQPPRGGDTPAGEHAVAVKLVSSVDPNAVAVEEFTITVAAFGDVVAEVVPRTSTGRRTAEHQLTISNRGNAGVEVSIEARDPDDALGFRLDPERLTIPADGAAIARVRARARRSVRGTAPLMRQMQFVVQPAGAPDVVVDASFLQSPAVPRWLRRAAIFGVLGLLALFLMWTFLVDPAVESHARKAVQKELAEPTGRPEITPGGDGGITSDDPATETGGDGAGANGAGGSSGGGDATVTRQSGDREPIDGRLFLEAPGTTSFEVPAGRTLELTDVVLQNPRGDSGELRVLRSGTVLLVVSLDNFRDIDYHFVTPIVFTAGQKLELSATCAAPDCKPGAYFSGALVRT